MLAEEAINWSGLWGCCWTTVKRGSSIIYLKYDCLLARKAGRSCAALVCLSSVQGLPMWSHLSLQIRRIIKWQIAPLEGIAYAWFETSGNLNHIIHLSAASNWFTPRLNGGAATRRAKAGISLFVCLSVCWVCYLLFKSLFCYAHFQLANSSKSLQM